MKTEIDNDGIKWFIDDNKNKCSVKYFDSEEAAIKALGSLKNCTNCTNCSGCSDCFGKKDDFEYPETPVIKNIHQEVLKAVSHPNAFYMSAWHTCETTHCRAGWVVHLARKAGKKLEEFHDTALAAQLIYKASSKIHVSPVRFFEDNEIAMEDIKRCAELEAQQGD